MNSDYHGGIGLPIYNEVNGKMEMDVEGVSPRPEPIPRSQGAGGACQAPPQPPQPQPQQQQQLAQDELPGESAGAEDSDDPETRPNGEKGESKYFSDRIHSGELGRGWLRFSRS
ncbi:transcriptional activator ptaB-like isoform X2 [Sciurus carolinensis]|nr:transcriptional activator ptaB-like isoform X2 [Sciurus carolinensis]